MRVRSRSGMTLVEILFAFAIISTILVVAYSAALRAWRSAVAANQRTEAQYVAQTAIEQVKAYRALSHSSTAQQRMLWSGTPGGGLGGFLQELRQANGRFTVTPCTAAQNCEWIVRSGGRVSTSPGDNTNFGVVIETGEVFCANASTANTISGLCNDSLQVTAVTLKATVTWTDATGIGSTAIASTILTEPD